MTENSNWFVFKIFIGIHKNLTKREWFLNLLCAGLLAIITNTAFGQADVKNPWAIREIGPLPPVASLTDGEWLKGELHVHSRHSRDADPDHSLSKIFAYARSVGMGFIAISDHDNHVRGDVAHHTWADPEFNAEDSLLVLYSAELTTTRGHGNTFSAKPYNHQRFYDVRDQRDTVVERVKNELGIHFSANHPSGNNHFGYSYDMVESIEIWNSSIWQENANAVMIWDDMLSSGRMLTGRGGSDAHHGLADTPEKETRGSAEANYNYIGTPTTWIFTRSHTLQGIIDALTNGRVSVSANPYAPRVEFYADVDGDGKMEMMMGDNTNSPDMPVMFRVQLEGNTFQDSTYTVNVVKNGRRFNTYNISGKTPIVEFTDTPVSLGRTYYRVTVEGPVTPYPQVPGSMKLNENMVGLSNPIYFNFDPNF